MDRGSQFDADPPSFSDSEGAAPVWLPVVSCAATVVSALPLLLWLAHAIRWPFGSLDSEVIGFLSQRGNTKPSELGLVALLILSSITWIPVVFRRWQQAIRRPARYVGLAVLIAILSAGLALHHSLPPTTLTNACVPVIVLLTVAAVSVAAETWVERSRRFDSRLLERIAALLLLAVPVTIFILAVGPRIAGDLELTRAISRIGSCGMGAFVALAGLVCVFGALDESSSGIDRALYCGRQLAWLSTAALQPRNPWVVGLAIVLCIGGLFWDGRRTRRDPSLLQNLWVSLSTWVFPFLVLALAQHNDPHGSIDYFHLGETATLAQEMLDGKRPYVESYIQHGLLRNIVLPAISLEAFEPTIAGLRFGDSIVQALTHVVAYRLAFVLLGSPGVSLVFSLACASQGLWFPDRFLPVFLFLTALIRGLGLDAQRGLDGLDRRQLALAGLYVILAVAWSVDVGIYAFATLLLAIVARVIARKNSESVRASSTELCLPAFKGLATGGIVLASALIALGGIASVPALCSNILRQSQFQLSAWGLPFPSNEIIHLREFFSPANQLVLALAVFLITITCWCIKLRSSLHSEWIERCLVVAWMGLCTVRTALGRSDEAHLRYPLPFALLIVLTFAIRVARQSKIETRSDAVSQFSRYVPITCVIGFALLNYSPLYGLIRQWIDLSTVRAFEATSDHAQLELPRAGGIMIPRSEAQFLATLHAEIHERIDERESFFDFSNMGALYFLFDRTCPTRYVAPVYAASAEMQRELIDDLERNRPMLAFSSRVFGYDSVDGIPMNVRAPLVSEYLHTHYSRAEDLGFGWLLTRVEP